MHILDILFEYMLKYLVILLSAFLFNF